MKEYQGDFRQYTTSDNRQYRIDFEMFSRLSELVRGIPQKQQVRLPVDSETMDFICKYLQNRRLCHSLPVVRPLGKCKDLQKYFEKNDLELIKELQAKGIDVLQKVFDAANYLIMPQFQNLLILMMAIQLIHTEQQQLIKQYNLNSLNSSEEEKLKEDFKTYLSKM